MICPHCEKYEIDGGDGIDWKVRAEAAEAKAFEALADKRDERLLYSSQRLKAEIEMAVAPGRPGASRKQCSIGFRRRNSKSGPEGDQAMTEIADEMVEAVRKAVGCTAPCTADELCACRISVPAVAPLFAAQEREALARLIDACKGLLIRCADPEKEYGPDHEVTVARAAIAAMQETSK